MSPLRVSGFVLSQTPFRLTRIDFLLITAFADVHEPILLAFIGFDQIRQDCLDLSVGKAEVGHGGVAFDGARVAQPEAQRHVHRVGAAQGDAVQIWRLERTRFGNVFSATQLSVQA